MIQTIIGSILTILLVFVIFFNTSFFRHWWNKNCGKQVRKDLDERLKRKRKYMSTQSLDEIDDNIAKVKFSDDTNESPVEVTLKQKFYVSLSVKVNEARDKLEFYISSKTKQELSAYLLLFILTTVLTTIQVMIIHGFARVERINIAKNNTSIGYMCDLLEENFLLEELIYLIPALLFFLILWFYHRQRHFNKYIMVKFKKYFKTKLFKKLQKEQKQIRYELKLKRMDKLKKKECGMCQYRIYKCFKNAFCRTLCCVFCCSCCVPPKSNNRCFLSYCCYQGWKQTDMHKVYTGKYSY